MTPVARCPVCKSRVGTNTTGVIRMHVDYKVDYCNGSYNRPEPEKTRA